MPALISKAAECLLLVHAYLAPDRAKVLQLFYRVGVADHQGWIQTWAAVHSQSLKTVWQLFWSLTSHMAGGVYFLSALNAATMSCCVGVCVCMALKHA